ncbi:uncharacterized protein KD926_002288 [Aspergillus affinis]|uniref:uncharacterized protein n=1 Tax=Aspergillus affinis TaxID=1070780 RepID=UPI0022FEE6B7|nr:uncharacterized protein KD926_002288 [Aspergillus affinis]KAI9043910.1 hypothetical protein KD926_002288 [Aspergillus affinis]
MVCRYIRECILRMGLRSGVFHSTAGRQPSVFLLEINPRAPGYIGLYASSWTYGVDLWALYMLHCVGDEARFRALSTPFTNGAQHDSAVLLIMPEKRGILRLQDPMLRLQHEQPHLAAAVPLCLNYFQVGQEVTPPDKTENVSG